MVLMPRMKKFDWSELLYLRSPAALRINSLRREFEPTLQIS